MKKKGKISNITNISKVMNDTKKRRINGKKSIMAIALTIAFFIYCIILLIKLLANPTNTVIVENGKIYKEESVEGYIIRDETVVQNNDTSAHIIHLKAEGDKVAKGEAIYRYSLENENEINKKISELDLKIQDAMKRETTFFSTDIKLLESQIETQLENVYESTNIQEVETYKKNISTLVTKKGKVAGELSPSDSYIKELINERSNYENQVNSNSNYVYSEKSGIISYRVDGLESTLLTGDFNYLNKDFLDKLKLRNSQIIAASSTQAKIIDNFKCYIACTSKTNEALNSKVGDKVKLRLSTSEEISAEIVHKSNEGDKEDLLVFEIDNSIEKLANYRKISFDIIWWSYSGIKIPNSSIKYEGDFAYIIRNRAGYDEKILIKVLRQNDNYSIVENYSTAELQEAGYDMNNLGRKKSISIYDEVYVNNKK